MSITKLRLIYLSVCLILFSTSALPQAPIVLKRADLMRTGGTAEAPIRYLDGDVWITQDTLSVTCEHATYEEAIGRLFFEDNVHLVEPSRQIWADQTTYYEKSGRAVADGNVKIDQDSIIIYCNRVIYNENREDAFFFGNVRIFSTTDDAVITGEHGVYNRPDERGVMTQDPRMVNYTEEGDSMVVVGMLIEYLFAEKQAIVTDSVHMFREDFEGWGQKLYYWDASECARLTGDPILQQGRDVLTADSVDAFFEDQKLKRVILIGQALVTSPLDSLEMRPFNLMSGHYMEMTFREGEVDSVYVRGNATSIYYIREDTGEKGANKVSGDLIDMFIKDGQIDWIYVEGGTEGTYYPERLEERLSTECEEIIARRRR
ncbi:hypothetical protein CEE37_04465 [candidate division LCP-89 bacterium B3_LCP]|uniref:Organic solvent tolerance-like N-terminal domain-containing protein n=1 Tax=candidate division LCP-89 bacterium B3_LCP TaxID=2012998 RepID=A0A532V4A0_UNCL8|nr:MAG: hypothetical protein CEE37_04465 [candidate division LCP-89 bacterium B3_LCP]